MADLTDFFRSVQLPTMPEVAHTLIKTLHDEDAPVEPVRKAIARDPALTVKLLRLANSARFGLPRTVDSVDDAITLVGMSQVRTLALSACLNDAFPVGHGLDRQAFWHSSMACAGYAQWLAGGIHADGQQAWLTGFMVRLGEIVIGQSVPGSLDAIERLPHLPGGRWERELEMLGFSEGQITAELARRWNFPDDIVHGLQHSADPLAAPRFSRLSGIIHLAELLAEIAPQSADALAELPADVVQALQLDADWMATRLPAPESLVLH